MRAATVTKLPFPDLAPSAGDQRAFWLSAWLRDLAKYEALEHHYHAILRKRSSDRVFALTSAMSSSCLHLRKEGRESLQELKQAGGLLFAWPGTTALQLLQMAAQTETVPA